MTKIAVLDFETTGLDTDTCWPVSVAVVHADLLGASPPRLVLAALVRPPVPIPPDASAIHGITDDDVADAPPWEDVRDMVLRALDGRWFGAYNVPYDLPILQRISRDTDYPVPQVGLDPLVWARELRPRRSNRLADVARDYGLGAQDHSAHGDALLAAQVVPMLAREVQLTFGVDVEDPRALLSWQVSRAVRREATRRRRPWTTLLSAQEATT